MSEQTLPPNLASFVYRHIGPRAEQISEMLKVVGCRTLDECIAKSVPANIRLEKPLCVNAPGELFPSEESEGGVLEADALRELRLTTSKNVVARSFIGLGYTNTVTPPVILRNILENPGWYTQYTPYQAEISQGRLEALLNFQSMIADLTGLEIANASLLDEGTAAAEAMILAHRIHEGEANTFFVSERCHPQTVEVVRTRAWPLGIKVEVGKEESQQFTTEYFGALLQYPASDGELTNPKQIVAKLRSLKIVITVAADILALAVLTPPGEWGADIVVGSSQRFGVPIGFGGPHAAYFATRDEYKRQMPGRLIGVSKDADGRPALRLSLQTREQHIRREKATSNICTAQVLLAVMASMYGVYHGSDGLKQIADTIAKKAALLAERLRRLGCGIRYGSFFDTIRVDAPSSARQGILARCSEQRINFRNFDNGSFGVTIDEATTARDLNDILFCFAAAKPDLTAGDRSALRIDERSGVFEGMTGSPALPKELLRTTPFLEHRNFNSFRSETELLRYIHRLQAKDLSLTTSMIPLGSCTMKLNATAEMIPVTWPELSQIHPFAPPEQTEGYHQMISELEQNLSSVTGLPGISLQPNSGSQGEYAGLLVVRKYLASRGETKRTTVLIPESAHGTNPASAIMAGFSVVPVKCDSLGNVDISDLRRQAEAHSESLAAGMITYPSTHGVFESGIREIADILHTHGAQLYMDGANMNAQVGLTRPGDFGVDVCHLNLHKTFCIPHGGGGPGVGPIAVAQHLKPFLPGHPLRSVGGEQAVGPVSAAPYGSAGILAIPWMYIRMMGGAGLTYATKIAILNANYIAARLEPHFPVLYRGENGMVAHECILELRHLKAKSGIEATDVAKRLMDYGFHAPTMSFPVPGTLMVEPTESESLEELDRFCDSMIAIREEIRAIEEGRIDPHNNPLKNAPHTAEVLLSESWDRPYSREEAAYPAPHTRTHKYWPPVSRVDNVYGDRNLICSCIGMDAIMDDLHKTREA